MPQLVTYNFVLTVAEGKRLIARGVAAMPAVQRAMQDGIVVVCKGSTNAYVAEELLGEAIPKGSYVLGRTVPEKANTSDTFAGALPEVVFVKGKQTELPLREAIAQMQRGDVIIKGANALNYTAGIAGLLVGHPEGGTLGALIGSFYGKGLHLVIPTGLEKEIAEDIQDLAELISLEPEIGRIGMPALWPVQGEIVTEIEAIELLTGAEAHQIAAGGLCGAEGGSWFGVWGTEQQIQELKDLLEQIQGEPAFGE